MVKSKESIVYKDYYTAADDVELATQYYGSIPGKSTAIAYLEEYNKTKVTNLQALNDITLPSGKTVKEKLAELDQTNMHQPQVAHLRQTFLAVFTANKKVADAQQKYKDEMDDLHTRSEKMHFVEVQNEAKKHVSDLKTAIGDEFTRQKTEVESLFTPGSPSLTNLTTCFGLKTPQEIDDFKKATLASIETKHTEALTNADKLLGDQNKTASAEYDKIVQNRAELAKLRKYPENDQLFANCLARKGIGAKNTLGLSGEDDANYEKDISIQELLDQLKIDGGKLYVNNHVQLKYNKEADSFESSFPGFRLNSKLEFITHIKPGRLISHPFFWFDSNFKAFASSQFKLFKTFTDTVSFDLDYPSNEKYALNRARLAFGEALLAGFEEKNISIRVNGRPYQVDDLFKEHQNQLNVMREKSHQEDQTRNKSYSMNRSDSKMFKEKIPRPALTTPADTVAKDKKEEVVAKPKM